VGAFVWSDDIEVGLRAGAHGHGAQRRRQISQRLHVDDVVARAAFHRHEQAPRADQGGIGRRRRHHQERSHRHRGRRGRGVDGIECRQVEIDRQARRFAPGDDQPMIGVEGDGESLGGDCLPGAVHRGRGNRLPVDVDPDARARVVKGECGGLVRCGRLGRRSEQFRQVAGGGEIDALGGLLLRKRRYDPAVGVGQCDRIWVDRHAVSGKITAGMCKGDDRRAQRGGGTGAAAGEQGGESRHEDGQGPRRGAAAAGANDAHHLSPSVRCARGRARHRRLEARTGNPFPVITVTYVLPGPENGVVYRFRADLS